MALLDILHFPDPRLRKVSKPVDKVDAAVNKLVDDMLETMYDAPGIGLAAPQINVHQRVVTIDVSEKRDSPVFLINPVIVATEGTEEMEEGCLSVPDQFAAVTRAEGVAIEYLDRDGKKRTLEADGLLAVCLQHEIDHLDGKLFVDYLSPLKRARIRKKLEKLARAQM